MIFSFVKKKFSILFSSLLDFELYIKKKYGKTQSHDLFISPKRKITILEMSLNSPIMYKLDYQMSRI